ncbi:hypothetical protein BDV3_002171 [Batrachochytrium dendrobatidis]
MIHKNPSFDFAFNDSKNDYFDIAQQLLINKRWGLYLTKEEGAVFELAARNHTIWTALVRDPLSCFEQPEFKALGFFCDEDEDPAQVLTGSMSQQMIIVFRIRTMLFEQLLPSLYGTSVTTALATASDTTCTAPETNSKAGVIEDSSVVSMGSKMDACRNLTQDIKDTFAHTDLNRSLSDQDTNDVADLIPIDDMYYSLEYDAELLKCSAIHDADETDASLKLEETNEANDIHASLKHLFQIIHEKADMQQLKDLRKLLADVRPSKSKWANDDRQGQEQLYEHLENVLTELKNYTEHSLPFLKPVQKREAPNYFDIIKCPMDLGTMSKKLKALQYNSKEDFANDLYLIWTNCMTYNTIPDSIYRRHATAMKRRSTDLLKKVPEITIKNSGDSDSDEDLEIKKDVKSINAINPIPEDSIAAVGNITEAQRVSTEYGGITASADMLPTNDVTMKDAVQPLVDLADIQSHQGQQEDPTDDPWMQTKKWKKATLTHRTKYLSWREDQAKLSFGDRLAYVRNSQDMKNYLDGFNTYCKQNQDRRSAFENGTCFKTCNLANDTGNAEESATDEHLLAVPEYTGTTPEHADINVTNEEDKDLLRIFQQSFLPELQHWNSSFPHLQAHPKNVHGDMAMFFPSVEEISQSKIPPAPLPTMSEYSEFMSDPKSILHASITKNILELQHIKDTFYKILAKQSPPQPFELVIPASIPRDPYHPLWKREDLPPATINQHTARAILRKMCSVIIAHAGFDGVCESALASITDVALHYFSNLGRTLRVYMDKYSRSLSLEVILLHTLNANGIENHVFLETYIQNDVLGLGTKLTDIRRKLDTAFAQLSRSADHMTADDDVVFEESQDQIISGNFFQDMGIDLLGLKDFGIDITSIPAELWNRKAEKPLRVRLKRSLIDAVAAENAADETQQEKLVKPFEPWQPIDPSKQIGLLKAFYDRKGMSVEELAINEFRLKSKDEKLLVKYAIQGRKRLPSGYLQAEETKKRKRKGDSKATVSTTPQTATPMAGVSAPTISPSHGPVSAHTPGATALSLSAETPKTALANPSGASSLDPSKLATVKSESKARKDDKRLAGRKGNAGKPMQTIV